MKKTIFIFLIFLVGYGLVEKASAIPAFARKYDMSCNVCHSPMPKLKPYGDEFARNGYQLPDGDPPRFYRETGDERLKLMRDLPVAIRFEAYGRYFSEYPYDKDLQTPYLMKFLSGGQISKDISYYFYFFFSEEGEIVGLEDAFFMFNNLFKRNLDLYVGQFQISDPLFKRELRLTLEDYKIYDTQVGLAQANLTYDRGLMVTFGLPTKTDIVVELLNGSGIGTAQGGTYDNDKNKNVLLRLSQEVGIFRVGGFGYFGKETSADSSRSTAFSMIGPDATISLDPVEINFQYVSRKDTNPYFIANDAEIVTRGGFLECIYSPHGDKSNWYLLGLYNWIRSDDKSLNYETLTGSYNYLIARNMRLALEYTYDMEQTGHVLSFGIVSGF